jgi:hypothetical protein
MERFMYNLTSSDLDVYFAANTAGQASIFLVAVLPALTLSNLCILALFSAEDINWKMRVLIINIFATENCYSLGNALFFLGFSLRFSDRISDDYSCRLALSLQIIAAINNHLANGLYAVMVYVFLKDGIKKVKWCAVLLAVAAAWTVSVALGIPVILYDVSFSDAGFCGYYSDSLIYRILVILTVAVVSVASCVIVTFSVLTFCYIRRNTLSGNSEVKKSIAKHLIYVAVAAVLGLVALFVPASFPAISEALADRVIVRILVVEYAFGFLSPAFNIISPIATIILLKPMQPALKQLFAKLFCRRNMEGRSRQGNEQGPNNEEEQAVAADEPINEGEPNNQRGATVRTQLADGEMTNEDEQMEMANLANDEPANTDELTNERGRGELSQGTCTATENLN